MNKPFSVFGSSTRSAEPVSSQAGAQSVDFNEAPDGMGSNDGTTNISQVKDDNMEDQGTDQRPAANVKGFGFRAPRHDYFIIKLEGAETHDEINKKLSELNVHPSSIINIEPKFVPDASVDAKNTMIIVFYKTKVEGSKFRVDQFYTTINKVESEDAINRYMQHKGISINDVISIASARVKQTPGTVPNIILLVHIKRQSNGADLS